jgi:DNA polymerase-3 subunit delta
LSARKPAGPPPWQVVAAVQRDLAKGWPAGLTVFTGDDGYHLDAAWTLLVGHLVPAVDEPYASSVISTQDRVDVADVVAAARSVGMFAPRRVVLLRDIERLEGDVQALTDYAKGPPPGSHLLVRAAGIDRRKKLHAALGSLGRQLVFDGVRGNSSDLMRQVQQLAEARGLRLTRDGAEALARSSDGDFYRLDREIDKLATWVGADTPRVDRAVVEELGYGAAALSGWEVADALGLRDRAAASAAALRLLAEGDEPLKLLGGLAYRARTMLQAKALLATGQEPGSVTRTVRLFGNPRPFFDGLERYSLPELLRLPSLLVEADRGLKGGALGPGAVLQRLIDRWTAPEGA